MSSSSDGIHALTGDCTLSFQASEHVPLLQHVCIHHAVELHAAQHPDRVALVFEEQVCTYRELNQRANQLAHRLYREGVGPEVLVGVAIERSIEMVVAILGILKAGGAYMPLSLKQPRDRLLFMLNDAGASILVTHEKVATSLSPCTVQMICLDQEAEQIARESRESPESEVQSAHLAYVIYTSGSTGSPKGTEITHANLVNLIGWHIHTYNMTMHDRATQLAEPGFDATVWEIWSALAAGAYLYVPDESTRLSPSLLRDWLLLHKITLSFVPTPLAEELLALPWPKEAPLRHLLTGGDILHTYARPELPFTLTNHYGPTECTVVATATPVLSHLEEHSLPPIGRPIANVEVYVLDRHLQPVPPGEVGEIYIGGAGVGRGYLHRPELTAERFVPNPWSNTPGARLYKTGDLARYLPDGNLAFLGRTDQQIKMRGLRIELGEIEGVLNQHPSVHSCIVTSRTDPLGEQRILAYLVPELHAETETEQKEDESALVTQWQELYEATYHQAPDTPDQTFQFVGWHSSYTGMPLPTSEMQENVQAIVDRIAGLHPRRVLEIGCGTGLLLFRLAPLCDYYLGTDFSPTALHLVQQQLASFPLPQVELAQRLADDLHDLPAGTFDTIILNSVIQHFPDLEYLLRVLEQVARLVVPGGRIFLGDLRDFPLLETFHASVQLYRASATLPLEQVRQRARQQMTLEKELVLAPQLFAQLSTLLPALEHVDVWLKRGRAHNELTLFRYDAILHLGPTARAHVAVPVLDWGEHDLSLAKLKQLLSEWESGPCWIGNVPNARLWYEHQAMETLRQPSPGATAGELRAALQATPPSEWVDPEALWQLAESLPYRVEVSIAASGRAETFDVLFCPRTRDNAWMTREQVTPALIQSWSAYASSPWQGNFLRQIAPRLRDFLRGRLPEYMVPSAFLILDRLPFNTNGKVDRRALPSPDWNNLIQEVTLSAPRTPLESHLAEIWIEVLQLKRVGRESNFFEVGGHSLLAMRMITRIRDELQLELPITTLFQFPTLAGLADQIEQARSTSARLAGWHIQRVEENTPPPLSFAQQRLWFFSQLMAGSPFYNVSTQALLRGTLQPDILEWSLNEVVRRHESLRTVFAFQEQKPVQIIQPELSLSLRRVDLRSVPAEQREAELHILQVEEAREPFDLTQEPLVRATLFQSADDHFLLLITMHHIICDGWSLSLFARELTLFYNARVEQRAISMPELPVRYRDYARWQQDRLQGALLEELQAYWKAKLGEHPPELDLPTDFPRPATLDYQGATCTLQLPRSLVDALAGLGQRETCTLPMVMLSAFKILLFRYTGQCDVIVGTPVAGRHLSEIESLIGFFINTLVLRTDLGGNPTVQEVLARVRETMLGAYTHQEFPFEKLVEELRPERRLSRNPLFQVMFAFQNVPFPALTLQGLAPAHLTVEKVDTQTANFDITLALTEVPEGISAFCEYNTALFRATTIERLLHHYAVVLAELVESPLKRLTEVNVLTERERRQILQEWARAGGSIARPPLVHELIEQQAERTPDAAALEYSTQIISYRELDACANQLARYLRARGAREETIVGICLERSPEMVIGLLGILKAGAGYLPLDSGIPPERLRFLLQDSGAEWLLTSTAFLPHVQDTIAGIRMLCLEDIWSEIAGTNSEPLPVVYASTSLAYLIYTSGSTGRPKGVMVSHEALALRVQSMIEMFQLGPGDRQFQFISPVFDAACEEIYPTLCAGATLLLSPRSPQHEGLDLWQEITALQPTKLDLPCAYWHLIVDEIARRTKIVPDSLRLLAVGGESPALEKLRTWNASLAHPVRFFNMYGPTEATIAASSYEMPPEGVTSLACVPIGRPLEDTTLYVLDTDLQPRPPGLPGELYIGGRGLARGYVRHPDLTAESFLPDPFSSEPGARLYHTGDLVRFLPDGNLEFLGRVDHQVKLRGFRIEPGEIENILLEHPAVEQCAVLLREDHPGQSRLVAYIVAPSDRQPVSVELHQFLSTHLPDYMVPSAWVLLGELPRNALYKLDRRALPAPDDSGIGSRAPYQPPGTPEEVRMVRIWSEVLHLETIGIHDNFFELGGHSLLATQVIARLREEGETEIMLHDLFDTPTPGALAAKLTQRHAKLPASRSTIQSVPRERFRRSAAGLPDSLKG